jgi:3-(3-hydroxy-phenyl)propionate hydroxylase
MGLDGNVMTGRSVVIAGGGPTGLMLAGELALAGVDVVVVERRADQHVDGSRAGGLHARTLEVLDQRGIAERFIASGQKHPGLPYAQMSLDMSDIPSRHNSVLALWQSQFEPILADWVVGLGVPIVRACEVIGFAQDDDGVDVALSDGGTMRTQYLVGCDGGRSLIRKAAGIDFVGLDASTSWMIAEAEMAEAPRLGFCHDDVGTHAIGPSGDAGRFRVVLTERSIDQSGDPDINALRDALCSVYGTDFGVHHPVWISRFTDASRQAESYRNGRVLLAGDAAHVHPPQGGQGLNTGVQDAVNLGWKLASVVHGSAPPTLLDTYHSERHPVGARVLHNTMAQVVLAKPDARHRALRDTLVDLLDIDEPRRRMAAMISGLDIRYDLGDGHPLVGRRMPDLDLDTASGPTRVFALLHEARGVLLDLAGVGARAVSPDIEPWTDRVQMVEASYEGRWDLPVVGEVSAPSAVLIRPDGHVAWTGDLADPHLPSVLTAWFGPR